MQVLIIGYVWPEPKSSAAGGRMMQLIDYFIGAGASVKFVSTAAPTNYMEDLEALGIKTAGIELNNPSFDLFLKDLAPDIVIYDRFMMEEQFGWRVNKICPFALTILDTEDLHFLRNFRELQFKNPKKKISVKDLDITKREIASIYRCDLSLIISEVEMKLLSKDFNIPKELLFYLPFLFDGVISEEDIQPNFSERSNFIFIGNFKHEPNVDAVFYLKDSIWPLIYKQLPNAQMHIYGAYPSAKINQLHQPSSNFYIKGRAKDSLEEVKKARVSLAPLRFGAGLKGKLLESMICGTPSITTTIGAEGMGENYPWNGWVTNIPEHFADAAIDIYTSRPKWEKAQKNGFKLLNSRFSKSQFYQLLLERLKVITETLEVHRQNNFIGIMLKHHSMRSTYLLSKFIEVKTELKKTTSMNGQRSDFKY